MPSKDIPVELRTRLAQLEKGHGKIMSLHDELKIISAEYADIRSKMETADVLMDTIAREMAIERKMRRLNMLLIMLVLLLTSLIVVRVSMGF